MRKPVEQETKVVDPPRSLSRATEAIWAQVEAFPVARMFQRKLNALLKVCRENLPEVDEALIEMAFQLAHWAHRNDKRASGEPYFTHPIEVAIIVARHIHFDDVCVAAALLHDVVEDNSDITVQHIEELFDPTLSGIVDGVTKIEKEFESREMRQAENFRKLLLSMASDIRVILVKFGDRLHNMRTLGSLPEKKQLKIAGETLELFAPLAHRFGLYSIKNEFEDLVLKIINPEAYYEISKGLKATKRARESYIKRFIEPLKEALKEAGFEADVYGRSKHIYSIYRKMRRQDKTLDEIYDLFAIRVILHSTGRQGKEECWRVYSMITDLYRPLPERFRDFISVPKSNGYQSLHTTVIGPDGKRVEVQIRTHEMHVVAEMGVAAHWRYKEDGKGGHEASDLDHRYAWVRELLENPDADRATEFLSDFQLDLADQEIYLFTPNGDLFTLPKGATPVDFAFRVHTEVGLHCNGAKVNGRVVPLSYTLKSGDQVAILTDKNKKPNPAWMKFVVTHKARSRIRHWINEERRQFIAKGQDIWEKRARKVHLEVSDRDVNRYASMLNFPNTQQMFFEIGKELFDVKELVTLVRNGGRLPSAERKAESDAEKLLQLQHERFIDQAQTIGQPALLINGEEYSDIATNYATCCKPIPGDPVFGFLSRNGGIKIHRKNCLNAPNLFKESDRIVTIEWSRQKDIHFMAALRVVGEDRVGIVNDITNVISKDLNTNIRSISVDAHDGVFEGTIVMYVNDLSQLQKIMDQLRRIEGIFGVYRFEE